MCLKAKGVKPLTPLNSPPKLITKLSIWPVLETIELPDKPFKVPETDITTLLAEFVIPSEQVCPVEIEILAPLHV
jgi:hypothetical protein